MSRTGATAVRVLAQLRRDPRTIALLLGVPTALVTLLRYVYDANPLVFQRVGAPLLGLFPFMSMFLVTSITMLRERRSGTLERLLTLPLEKLDLLLGYAAAFGAVAAVEVAVVSAVAFGLLGLDPARPAWTVALLAVANAELGMALGLFVSAFARTEFQAVQFLPAFVLPQLVLCGLLAPRASLPAALRWASNALPLTYAYDALARLADGSPLGARFAADVAVTLAGSVAALVLGALTLRRRTA